MPNRLAHETSPYLRQHQHNPVDWYPWCEEALQRARNEDRPIFLSIGYAACHWCHVMERESFENPAIARFLNEHFVSIKVDREERPDLDQIYMTAVQMMTGRGGWPMSVFLTPDLRPFYGGTYWPPQGRYGMPGFRQVLEAVVRTWRERRQQAESVAAEVVEGIIRTSGADEDADDEAIDRVVSPAAIGRSAEAIAATADRRHGGFGGAPKFPQPQALRFLLRAADRRPAGPWRAIVRETLDAMYRGGIYDHLGGGFARYSVDDHWLVPHFEKMLYDNAQLATTYVEAYQVFGEPWMARVARETLDYLLRDMRHESGGFYSSQDADSEGVEGKYYVWTRDEFESVLGDRAASFAELFGVTREGNWEGVNVLHLPRPLEAVADADDSSWESWWSWFAAGRGELFEARTARTPPATDDKIVTSWNGLAIEALALAGSVLEEPQYVEAAAEGAEFAWRALRSSDGRLLHTWRGGTAHIAGFLDDYAALAAGMWQLFQATFDGKWLSRAEQLADEMRGLFYDPQRRRLDYVGGDQPTVIARLASVSDSGTPAAVGLAAAVWGRLAVLGREDFEGCARAAVGMASSLVERAPLAVASSLLAADWLAGPVTCDVIRHRAGDAASDDIGRRWRRAFRPRSVLVMPDRSACSEEFPASLRSLLADKTVGDEITLYRCVGRTCDAPVVGLPMVRATIDPTS